MGGAGCRRVCVFARRSVAFYMCVYVRYWSIFDCVAGPNTYCKKHTPLSSHPQQRRQGCVLLTVCVFRAFPSLTLDRRSSGSFLLSELLLICCVGVTQHTAPARTLYTSGAIVYTVRTQLTAARGHKGLPSCRTKSRAPSVQLTRLRLAELARDRLEAALAHLGGGSRGQRAHTPAMP